MVLGSLALLGGVVARHAMGSLVWWLAWLGVLAVAGDVCAVLTLAQLGRLGPVHEQSMLGRALAWLSSRGEGS